MNRLLLPIAAGATACFAFGSATAQIVPNAVPWVSESDTRFAAAVDQNTDGRPDLVLLDKATGTFVLGIGDDEGALSWTVSNNVGFTGAQAMAVGQFTSARSPVLAVSSRTFNGIQYAPLDGSALPDALVPGTPEPTTLAALRIPEQTDAAIVGYAGFIDGFFGQTLMEAVRPDLELGVWQSYDVGLNLRQARIVHTSRTAPGLLAVVFDELPPASGSRLQFFQADGNAAVPSASAEFTGSSRYVHGFFDADLPVLNAGGHSTTLLSWTSSLTYFQTSRITHSPASGFALQAGGTFLLGRPIRQIHVLCAAPAHRLLVIWNDTPGASVFAFDGTNPPTLIENVELGGLDPDTLVPVAGGGDFYVFGNEGGMPRYARFSDGATPGHYTRKAQGAVPSTARASQFFTNFLALRGEAFVDPQAFSVARVRQRDWTVSGQVGKGTVLIGSLADGGLSAGLGDPASGNVAVPPATTHILPNQYRPAASISFQSARTNDQILRARVAITPAGGLYAAGTTVQPSFSVSNDDFVVYSVNGGPWRQLNLKHPFPPPITTDTVLRAYSVSSSTYRPGPIETESYTFGTLPPVAVSGFTDANHNGLSDAWEQLTGLTDPNGDADGDGLLNLAEHNAGTDPNDPTSRPPALSEAPRLTLHPRAGADPARLTWSAADAAVVLQESADLQAWSVVIDGITAGGMENSYRLPVETQVRKFYRLRR